MSKIIDIEEGIALGARVENEQGALRSTRLLGKKDKKQAVPPPPSAKNNNNVPQEPEFRRNMDEIRKLTSFHCALDYRYFSRSSRRHEERSRLY